MACNNWGFIESNFMEIVTNLNLTEATSSIGSIGGVDIRQQLCLLELLEREALLLKL